MALNRILVAAGLAKGPDPAFERALTLAAASGAELYVLHAVPADRRFSFRADERRDRAGQLRQRAEAAGVRAQTIEQQGDPAEIIVLHADARPVDLIVMASERRTGWARLRQPSVAERVLRRTKRPTLLAGADAGRESMFSNMLVAVDLSPASEGLADTAMTLAGGGVRRLTIAHAVDSAGAAGSDSSPTRWMVPEYRAFVLDDVRRQLGVAMPESIDPRLDVDFRVASGPAARTIDALAANIDADLIVVGRSRRFMHLGSTAVQLLRNTRRAVLVVPPEAHRRATNPDASLHRAA